MHKLRKAPILYQYAGMNLLIGTYKSNGRIDISFRIPGTKETFVREYTPVTQDPAPIAVPPPKRALQVGQHPSEDIINWTLQTKFAKFFLPALFKHSPDARNGKIHFRALGEYALHMIQSSTPYADSTREVQEHALARMISLWGNRPMQDIIPSNCGNDLTNNMEMSTATTCISLLRQIYPVALAGCVDDLHLWTRYRQVGRKPRYSATRQVRKQLLNVPLPPGKICAAIKRCINLLETDTDAAKALAALVILIEGITVEEACALQANSLTEIAGYPNSWQLIIKKIIVSQRHPASGNHYSRDARHIIVDTFPPEARTLGCCRILSHYWHTYAIHHPEFAKNQLLLHNPDNRNRTLSPNQYRQWLNETFSDLLPDNTLAVDNNEISTSFDVEDVFRATSQYLLSDLAGYSSEELRHHFAKKPLKMDGKHYAGFDSPSALVTQGIMQDRALAYLLGCICPLNTSSSKIHQIPGQAGHISRIHLEIDAEKMLSIIGDEHDLILRLSALGFSQKIAFIANDID